MKQEEDPDDMQTVLYLLSDVASTLFSSLSQDMDDRAGA